MKTHTRTTVMKVVYMRVRQGRVTYAITQGKKGGLQCDTWVRSTTIMYWDI